MTVGLFERGGAFPVIAEIIKLFGAVKAPNLDGRKPVGKVSERMTRGHGPVTPTGRTILVTTLRRNEPPRPAAVPPPQAPLPKHQAAVAAAPQLRPTGPKAARFSQPARGISSATPQARPKLVTPVGPSVATSYAAARQAIIPIGIEPPPLPPNAKGARPLRILVLAEERLAKRLASRLAAEIAAYKAALAREERMWLDLQPLFASALHNQHGV